MTLRSGTTNQARRYVLVDLAVSSDDSEILVSFEKRTEDDLKVAAAAVTRCFLVDKAFGKYVGIYESIKTTTQLLMVSEFNSEFTFHKNTIRPLLRWVTAVNLISEQESLAGRQEEMASNLTNVLSGGGRFSLTSHCEISQAILHYLLLGSRGGAVFDEHLCELKKIPDPGNGFFLMDFPFFAGLCGFKYNLWSAVKKTDLGKCYHSMIRGMDPMVVGVDASQTKKLTLETTKGGSFIHTRIIKWGNRKRHARLIENMALPSDWSQEIDRSPEVLYRKSKNSNEVLLKLAKKLHAPGVSTSLSKGVNVSRKVASSVYITSKHVLSESSLWYEQDVKGPGKSTLLLSAIRSREMATRELQTVTQEEIRTLFIFDLDYMFIANCTLSFTGINGAFSAMTFRKVTTRIEVGETSSDILFSPLNLVRWKWFNIDCLPASNNTVQLSSTVKNWKFKTSIKEYWINCDTFLSFILLISHRVNYLFTESFIIRCTK